jgi:hypothetical protein
VVKSKTLRWNKHVPPEGRKDLKVDGRIILIRISKKWVGGMDRIDLTQDRDRWWAFVNAVMNLRVP